MMSFEEKLNKQFLSFKISVLNEPKVQYHLYADFVELICLVSSSYVSRSDILDRLTDEGEKFSPENETPDGAIGLRDSEVSDAKEKWINIIFELLEDRADSFSESYPFIIDKNGILLREGEKTDIQLIYIYLLISSSLKYFGIMQDILTSEFEYLCESVLKNYLPPKAIVRQFGKNTSYKGSAKAKIQKLADDLLIKTNDHYLTQISNTSSQEEGLDIIGWIPFDDKNPNTIIILGQCACGKNWITKQHETRRYENYFQFYINSPVHSLFLPYALSKKDGFFFQDKDISKKTLIFERRRLIEYSKDFKLDDSFLSKRIVKSLIQFREDIV